MMENPGTPRQKTLAELQDQMLMATDHLSADCALQVGLVKLNSAGYCLSESFRHHDDDPDRYLACFSDVALGLCQLCSSTGIGLDEVFRLALATARAQQAKLTGPTRPPRRPSFLPFRV